MDSFRNHRSGRCRFQDMRLTPLCPSLKPEKSWMSVLRNVHVSVIAHAEGLNLSSRLFLPPFPLPHMCAKRTHELCHDRRVGISATIRPIPYLGRNVSAKSTPSTVAWFPPRLLARALCRARIMKRFHCRLDRDPRVLFAPLRTP